MNFGGKYLVMYNFPKLFILPILTPINRNIKILDIIQRLVFYLKQGVSETGFCLRLPIDRDSKGTESSVRNVMLQIKDRTK
jgi:hypothetical protein